MSYEIEDEFTERRIMLDQIQLLQDQLYQIESTPTENVTDSGVSLIGKIRTQDNSSGSSGISFIGFSADADLDMNTFSITNVSGIQIVDTGGTSRGSIVGDASQEAMFVSLPVGGSFILAEIISNFAEFSSTLFHIQSSVTIIESDTINLGATGLENINIIGQLNIFQDLDLNTFNIINVNELQFQTAGQLFESTVGGIAYRVPLGDFHLFSIDGNTILNMDDTEAKFFRNVSMEGNRLKLNTGENTYIQSQAFDQIQFVAGENNIFTLLSNSALFSVEINMFGNNIINVDDINMSGTASKITGVNEIDMDPDGDATIQGIGIIDFFQGGQMIKNKANPIGGIEYHVDTSQSHMFLSNNLEIARFQNISNVLRLDMLNHTVQNLLDIRFDNTNTLTIVPGNIPGIGYSSSSIELQINVPLGGSITVRENTNPGSTKITSNSIETDLLTADTRFLINVGGTMFPAPGFFVNDGTDVFVYSGGESRNMSDIGTGGGISNEISQFDSAVIVTDTGTGPGEFGSIFLATDSTERIFIAGNRIEFSSDLYMKGNQIFFDLADHTFIESSSPNNLQFTADEVLIGTMTPSSFLLEVDIAMNANIISVIANMNSLGLPNLPWSNVWTNRLSFPDSTPVTNSNWMICQSNDNDLQLNVPSGQSIAFSIDGFTQMSMDTNELLLSGVDLSMDNNSILDVNQIEITGVGGDVVKGRITSVANVLDIIAPDFDSVIRLNTNDSVGSLNPVVKFAYSGGFPVMQFDIPGVLDNVVAINFSGATIIKNIDDLEYSVANVGEHDFIGVVNLRDSDLIFQTAFNTINFANSQTNVGSAGVADALPANPEGYIRIKILGDLKLIPYYNFS